MKKIFAVSLIPVMLFLVFSFIALPAGAQVTPKESCEISRDITMKVGTLTKIPGSPPPPALPTIVGSTMLVTQIAGVADGSDDEKAVVAKWGSICLINAINNIVDWIFLFLLVISVALIAIAGFLWMTSGGDAQKTKTAGAMIAAALIGIVIALLARVLPAVVLSILG